MYICSNDSALSRSLRQLQGLKGYELRAVEELGRTKRSQIAPIRPLLRNISPSVVKNRVQRDTCAVQPLASRVERSITGAPDPGSTWSWREIDVPHRLTLVHHRSDQQVVAEHELVGDPLTWLVLG